MKGRKAEHHKKEHLHKAHKSMGGELHGVKESMKGKPKLVAGNKDVLDEGHEGMKVGGSAKKHVLARKRGGACKADGGAMHHKHEEHHEERRHGGKVHHEKHAHGGMARHHEEHEGHEGHRRRRASGGEVGADRHPYSSAH